MVESAADLPEQLPGARIGVVVQTTQSEGRLSELVAALARAGPRIACAQHHLQRHRAEARRCSGDGLGG